MKRLLGFVLLALLVALPVLAPIMAQQEPAAPGRGQSVADTLEAIQKAGISTESAEIGMVPKNLMKLEGKNAGAMLRLSEALEENDDVQNVYSNFDIDEKEMEALAS